LTSDVPVISGLVNNKQYSLKISSKKREGNRNYLKIARYKMKKTI